eukprot:gb/GEZJ01008058.1/.p1 GENE.gb/GEZJ01008058.1/~~gb/GEZJ01008058.1/.p1  ORF type:complete len:110 (+),score=16.01 gb/GEZJ01008058.1/:447-776(+)
MDVVVVRSSRACFLCLSIVRTCAYIMYLSENARKHLLILREENYNVRRSEEMFNMAPQRATEAPGSFRYATLPNTPMKAPQVHAIVDPMKDLEEKLHPREETETKTENA